MSAPFVVSETAGRVRVLTMSRSDTSNAFSYVEDCLELAGALHAANADKDISVVIVTGAGRNFCSGGDLKTINDRNGIGPLATPDDTRANYRAGVQTMIRAFADVEVATIAAINGAAIGLGLDVAGMCDLRICAQSAKLASSFAKLGIVPGDGGAWILQRLIGYPRAAELILTGDAIDAETALAYGLVNKVVADGDALSAARAMAERIASNPPRAVRLSKRLLREAQHQRLSDVLELSAAFQALAHETADHKEALSAFFDKRPPNFTGG